MINIDKRFAFAPLKMGLLGRLATDFDEKSKPLHQVGRKMEGGPN